MSHERSERLNVVGRTHVTRQAVKSIIIINTISLAPQYSETITEALEKHMSLKICCLHWLDTGEFYS